MARSIWKGALGFGMVTIPVKLYGATEERKITMNQLHGTKLNRETREVEFCGGKVAQPRRCPACDEALMAELRAAHGDENIMELANEYAVATLAPDDIIKGYPIGKNNWVPLTKAELDMLPLSSLKSIQVDAFVSGRQEDLDTIDVRYFKTSYFLAPEEVGAKGFVLFVTAMEKAGVMGIAKIAIREKEQLCALRPYKGILLLQTMHWADELRDCGDLIPFASITDQEMEMAGSLIKGMTKDVDLTLYEDDYRTALIEMINAKLDGKTIEAPPEAPKPAEVDLAKQLMASLNALTPA